jgi:predicted alpha/beta-hydrolase family hydrolase
VIDRRLIETPQGAARLVQRRSVSPWATLVLTHGAGRGVDAPDLAALATGLPRRGISVALVEQPWRVAGKRIASRPEALDDGFAAVVNRLRPRTPMFVGGRSAGARVACRTGRLLGAVGVVALAFPLHPPGRPEKSRVEELLGSELPTLVVQGERDSFGQPAEFPPQQTIVSVPDADHSFKVPKRAETTADDALEAVVDAAAAWIDRRVRQ